MKVEEFVTNDMTLAAYLKIRGCKLIKARKLGDSFKFIFEKPESIEQLQVDLANSEIVRFDAAVRDLKRVVYSSYSRKKQRR